MVLYILFECLRVHACVSVNSDATCYLSVLCTSVCVRVVGFRCFIVTPITCFVSHHFYFLQRYADELKSVLKSLGQKVKTKYCKNMIRQYDKNATKRMEFKEFLDMMANVFQYHLSHPDSKSTDAAEAAAQNQRMEELFDSLDQDESGFIDPEEIIKLTEQLGEKMTIEEVKDLIKQVDKDGDGRVDKEEFKRLMSAK